MPAIAPSDLNDLVTGILHGSGLPEDQARRTAGHLVESNLMGHDSHGVMRVPGYAEQIEKGSIKALGSQTVERDASATAVVDADRSIGILMAYEAMEMATRKAEAVGVGVVTVRRASHIGRLGAFPPLAAAKNCVGIIMLNGGARFAAPFGGTDRRLPPNPLAISVPTDTDDPMMLDITTSMVAGGKLEVLTARNQEAPEGWLVDGDGNTVTDPALLRTPHAAMLPLGGALGHKGYGLSMMIDVMAGALSRAGCSQENPTRGASGFLCMALQIEAFVDMDEYRTEVRHLIDWIKSSRLMPGTDQIYLPGEIEQQRIRERTASGIPIEDATWNRIVESASKYEIPVPA
ncbi:MAG: Ldh family oxidoreductase [Caldilineaceae bacterium SB0662_bin_9]|uniref:Ldh family oxidoreductase n=1 Tax=Caldilineaceae bacterium SB0662_bin_9 TaxID=2605258 RepID=A0A6B1DQQ0_9CHLR|nr:Ldh family oxidoreductase [Caldilineaceae bacterium SB0662_bin_9]